MDRRHTSRWGARSPGAARLVLAWALLAGVAASGCTGASEPAPEGGIERDVFVSTFVDLRLAALTRPGRTLTDPVRDSILEVHGVTEEQLLEFVDIHGTNVDFMSEVWDSVEARIDRLEPVDSVRIGSAGAADDPEDGGVGG